MFNILQRAKLKTILPWVSLGIDCLGLCKYRFKLKNED